VPLFVIAAEAAPTMPTAAVMAMEDWLIGGCQIGWNPTNGSLIEV
jgi:hypothetical protein